MDGQADKGSNVSDDGFPSLVELMRSISNRKVWPEKRIAYMAYLGVDLVVSYDLDADGSYVCTGVALDDCPGINLINLASVEVNYQADVAIYNDIIRGYKPDPKENYGGKDK